MNYYKTLQKNTVKAVKRIVYWEYIGIVIMLILMFFGPEILKLLK